MYLETGFSSSSLDRDLKRERSAYASSLSNRQAPTYLILCAVSLSTDEFFDRVVAGVKTCMPHGEQCYLLRAGEDTE